MPILLLVDYWDITHEKRKEKNNLAPNTQTNIYLILPDCGPPQGAPYGSDDVFKWNIHTVVPNPFIEIMLIFVWQPQKNV